MEYFDLLFRKIYGEVSFFCKSFATKLGVARINCSETVCKDNKPHFKCAVGYVFIFSNFTKIHINY